MYNFQLQKEKKMVEEKESNPEYQKPRVFSLNAAQSNDDMTRWPSCITQLPDLGGDVIEEQKLHKYRI